MTNFFASRYRITGHDSIEDTFAAREVVLWCRWNRCKCEEWYARCELSRWRTRVETDEGDKASRAGEEAKGVDAEAGGDQGNTQLVVS